ncbi:MAG: mechanosensitive ion channel [Candidatus Nezhaarchaeota archaeon]|nr:mechanosensitive ion channel [Candidatus Nezhaarchaeota archaeon]
MFELSEPMINLLLRIVMAIIAVASACFISNYARSSLERVLSKFGAEFAKRVAEVFRYFIIFIGVVAAISILSLETTILTAIAVIIVVLLIIGLRDVILNLTSELYLVLRRPFKVGDQIKVGDVEGTVRTIKALDTEIITYEGDLVIVPNSYFLKNPIINKSQSIVKHVELRLTFHGKGIGEVRNTVQEVLMEIKPELFGEPEVLTISEKENKVEALVSIPIVNVRKLRWLVAKIARSFSSRGLEVEVE